jgi:hypothetical protein
MRRPFAIALVALAAVVTLSLALRSQAQDETPRSVSGPFAYENLAIYLVHGPSAPGPAPLTLQEALEQGDVIVRETGDVNELVIENKGQEAVFVQSGDIVKGGRQDRVITSSLVLPPQSGEIAIDSYCVEAGRWSRREGEAVDRFASSLEAMPSREAKLALRAPEEAYVTVTGSRQGDVWDKVTEVQTQLETNLGQSVAAEASPTSLQLSIEHGAVGDAREAYIAALAEAGRAENDVIGQVVVINGEISSADLYPSNSLFKKMWDKNLRASAVEALSRRDGAPKAAAPAPAPEDVDAFLISVDAESGATEAIVAGNSLETRETEKAFGFETERDGEWVHKSYLAR